MLSSALPFTEKDLISTDEMPIHAELKISYFTNGIIIVVGESGACRHDPAAGLVATLLGDAGLGTLVCDLLSDEEQRTNRAPLDLRFRHELLKIRLVHVFRWLRSRIDTSELQIGIVGLDGGGQIALSAAAELGDEVSALVAIDSHLDTEEASWEAILAPTLLIVGGGNEGSAAANEEALGKLWGEKEMRVIVGRGRLLDRPEETRGVIQQAAQWFRDHLTAARATSRH